MRYVQIHDGDVITPRMRGYRMRCCDCGLVHIVDFYVTRKGRRNLLRYRIRRDPQATRRARARLKKT